MNAYHRSRLFHSSSFISTAFLKTSEPKATHKIHSLNLVKQNRVAVCEIEATTCYGIQRKSIDWIWPMKKQSEHEKRHQLKSKTRDARRLTYIKFE